MNYSKTIRNYCLQNEGDIFDVSYMKDTYFGMIPYKTLLKILNRLEEEHILTGVSKGVYLIGNDLTRLEDAIVRHFISDNRGMFAGYAMFNQLNISDYHADTVEIYTRQLTVENRTIGRYQLKKIDLPFTDRIIPIIMLLDCIEKGFAATDISVLQRHEVCEKLAESYTDTLFRIIIPETKYQYATIVTLKELLDRKNIKNDSMGIYERMSR